MTNALGQGANQAIEDSLVLARCLADADDPAAGLRGYEAERIPRTTKFASMSWSLARASRLHNPAACLLRNVGLTMGFRFGFARQHPGGNGLLALSPGTLSGRLYGASHVGVRACRTAA